MYILLPYTVSNRININNQIRIYIIHYNTHYNFIIRKKENGDRNRHCEIGKVVTRKYFRDEEWTYAHTTHTYIYIYILVMWRT